MAAASAEAVGWQERVRGGGERGEVRRAMEEGEGKGRGGRRPQRVVLHLFAGPQRGEDSFTAACARRGWQVVEVDVEQGGAEHDLCDDAVFARLLARVRRREFGAVVAGIPCATFSVARLRPGFARPLRGRRGQARGLPGLSQREGWRVQEANELAVRTAVICEEIARLGGEFVIENPIDRGDPALPWVFSEPDHCPLWALPAIKQLQLLTKGEKVHFPQCAFDGARFQKWTTLLASPGIAASIRSWGLLRCQHDSHDSVAAGYDMYGEPTGPRAAAYPSGMNEALAEAITGGGGAVMTGGDWLVGRADPGGRGAVVAEGGEGREEQVRVVGGGKVGGWLRACLAGWPEAPAVLRAVAAPPSAVGRYSMARLLPEREEVVRVSPVDSAESTRTATDARTPWQGRHGEPPSGVGWGPGRSVGEVAAWWVDVGHKRRRGRRDLRRVEVQRSASVVSGGSAWGDEEGQ